MSFKFVYLNIILETSTFKVYRILNGVGDIMDDSGGTGT